MLDFVGSPSTCLRTPVNLEKCPFTLEIIMCLTLNSAVAWAGSMFQVLNSGFGIAKVLIWDPFWPFGPATIYIDALPRYSLQHIFKFQITPHWLGRWPEVL